MRAEEFELSFCKIKFGVKYTLTCYDKPTLHEMMEAYHQSRVNGISDEDIKKELIMDEIVGAKWIKEQLLKQ